MATVVTGAPLGSVGFAMVVYDADSQNGRSWVACRLSNAPEVMTGV